MPKKEQTPNFYDQKVFAFLFDKDLSPKDLRYRRRALSFLARELPNHEQVRQHPTENAIAFLMHYATHEAFKEEEGSAKLHAIEIFHRLSADGRFDPNGLLDYVFEEGPGAVDRDHTRFYLDGTRIKAEIPEDVPTFEEWKAAKPVSARRS